MYNIIPLNPTTLPVILMEMGTDDVLHNLWLLEVMARYETDQLIGQEWFIVKNYQTPGGFTYPYCAWGWEKVVENIHRVRITNHF
jgi:hypothetical protein